MNRFRQVISLCLLFGLPAQAQVITQWNFNASLTAPTVGAGSVAGIGGVTTASNNGGGPSDPASPNSALEVSTFPAATAANNTAGIELAVSTVGQSNIFLTFDQRPSNTSPKRTTVFYSTDGGTNWVNFGFYDAPTGDGYFSRSYDFSAITALNNNPNARFKLVAGFSDATNTAYTAATNTSTYATTGRWRFDMLTVRSGSGVTTPTGTPNRATEQSPVVIGTINGTNVSNGGYGSDLKAVPGQPGFFYGLTDRGPNVSGTNGGKAFPVPGYTPMIGKFELVGTSLVLRQQILLKDAAGVPLNGLPNAEQNTANGYLSGQDAEPAQDAAGNTIAPNADNRGIDSEGLAVMSDGTFWVSDEYGPYLYHVSATGVTLEKVSPIGPNSLGHSLPSVFLRRRLNNGMEGLSTNLSGDRLVGIMQNRLLNPTPAAVSSSRVVRILSYDPVTGNSQQFAYVLESTATDVCAIFPLTATDYLVLERDGNTSLSAFKRVYRISLAGATDISDPTNSAAGKLYGGQTVEQLNNVAGLAAQGVVAVTKTLVVDLQTAIPGGYPHEKAEGLIVTANNELAIINDDDFGVSGTLGSVTPKLDANGVVDQTRLYFVPLAGPLPVTYLSFGGYSTPTGPVLLTWETVAERDNARFEVERSADARTFEPLGNVPGTGTTTTRHQYTYLDEAPLPGLAYYRLRQVDLNGTSAFSKTIAIRTGAEPTVLVYPNPTANRLLVRWEAASDGAELLLYDATGLVRVQASPTGSLTEMRVDHLPPGRYVLQCRQPDQAPISRAVLVVH